MQLVKRFKAERLVHKLKESRGLGAAELEAVQREIVAAGPAAIEPLLRCLAHTDAREPAAAILAKLLCDDTVGLFVEALSSADVAVVSGVTQVLADNKSYDPAALLGFLADPAIPRAALETILLHQAAVVAPRRILLAFPAVGKEARVVLFRVLERAANHRSVRDLVPLLANEDWWVRLQAVKLLARFNDPEVIQGLERLLADENRQVRLQSVLGLHALQARNAVPALVQRLRDADLKVQTAAIDALMELGDASTVSLLVDVLTDESEHARRGAVEVLNVVATPEAVQDLVRALHDEDWWVRVRAADALGSLGGDKVVEAVLGLLHGEDEFIRRYVIEILNTIPDRRAVPALVQALQDPDWWVRERAIDALGNIADPRAVDPLLDVMHNDPKTVPLCIRALGRIGDLHAIESLCLLAESEREEVGHQALEALVALSRTDLPPECRAQVQLALQRSPRRIDPLSPAGGSEPFANERRAPAPASASGARWHDRAPQPQPHPLRPQVAGAPAEPAARPASASAGHETAMGRLNFALLPEGTMLLERYRVLRRVGTGGFGAVYLVLDTFVREEVILKILNPQLSADPNSMRRFVQELKLSRKITHPNVIRIFDFLDLGSTHAVSMEYFPGKDLGRILDTAGTLPPRRTVEIVVQICRGLAAAHAAGVIHRDIKPGNILVGADDTVKIVDFGLASAHQQGGSRLTKSGLLIGTPEYMAPELIRGDTVDHRSDIYSLGIMMYEMLSGRKPFAADTPVKTLFQHLEAEAEPVGNLVPGLPEGIARLVTGAMARDRDDRPADVRALQSLLEQELAQLPNPGNPHAEN